MDTGTETNEALQRIDAAWDKHQDALSRHQRLLDEVEVARLAASDAWKDVLAERAELAETVLHAVEDLPPRECVQVTELARRYRQRRHIFDRLKGEAKKARDDTQME